jgi:RNA-directed DNA polymerase
MSRPRNTHEESEVLIVPEKLTNAVVTPAESVEERSTADGNPGQGNAVQPQSWEAVHTRLERVGERAKQDKEAKFDNVLSLVTAPLLRRAYEGLRKGAAAGIDNVTWAQFGEQLDERLDDLIGRIHRGSYHPQPVRRVFIPKADGRMRPLGIPALEDKVVQQAVKMVLERIYEPAFLGFSYGFRPGRNQHGALDALAVAISRRVEWVLDADIKAFFDTIDHAWMQRFLEHRIGDRRMVRLLMKWLHAGVMEEGKLLEVERGTPQGGIISPLLANIYLHYALDLWAHHWRRNKAAGDVYVVRYADDFVMGFQLEQDARAMRDALTERLAPFGLELHPDKTRVIAFGKGAWMEHERDRSVRLATFDFLGFTHVMTKTRSGRFTMRRRTSRKKRTGKLQSLREEFRERRHHPVVTQHKWISSVLRGHYGYYGVPGNSASMKVFRWRVECAWLRSLERRSQRARMTEADKTRFRTHWPLPPAKITHPWPDDRFARR